VTTEEEVVPELVEVEVAVPHLKPAELLESKAGKPAQK
jgi:hypothetical protein